MHGGEWVRLFYSPPSMLHTTVTQDTVRVEFKEIWFTMETVTEPEI